MLGEDHFELRTKRLLLRPLVLEDWPAVQRNWRASIGVADAGLDPHAPGLRRQCRLGSPSGGIAARRAFVRRL